MKAVRIGIICCVAATAGFAVGPSGKRTSSPDVFLVTIDTLRADHVHCYGYDSIQTPALDGLAKDGIRFAQAFTPSPITNTSHTTILTGLLPDSHGVTDFGVPLAVTHPTWAELLKKKGYHTAAFIGAAILDSNTLAPGLDRGFDFYDNFPDHPRTKSRWGRVERRGMDVVRHAETWLDANRVGPRFVWVHLYDPHAPYEPPPPYSQTYKDHLYDGEIAYADGALANFVNYLKNHGWWESSMLIVVGDHGEGLGEHREDTHGIFLYDSTTHVPLIVKLPGGTDAGKVVDGQVRTTDILPTVTDLLHVPAPALLDGESLRPYFTGIANTGRTSFGETDYPSHFGWAPLHSVREEGFKLIDAPRPELYDLYADPGELRNIYRPWDATVQKLRAMLVDLRAKMPPSPPPAGSVGQGTLDELKALGYLGPADVGTSTNVSEPSLLPDPKDKIEQQNLLQTAMIALEDDRPEQARGALEKVLELEPKSPTALRQLGELELQAGDYAKAAEYLKSAREVQPQDATAAFDEGQALEKTGNLSSARDALEASLKITPEQFRVQLLLGKVYLGMKEAQAAEEEFEAAFLLQPKSLEAQLGVAKAQIAESSFADAAQKLEPLSRSYPGNPQVFELLAQVYRELGKKEQADKAQRKAKVLGKK
jgi:choline-sulfatase